MPSWPDAVQTTTLIFGKGITVGGNMTSSRLVVEPVFQGTDSVVWAADGTPMLAFSEQSAASDGSYGSIQIPVVDQDGWLDSGQHPYTMWGYKLTETPSYGNAAGRQRIKYWQPLTGQTTVDFDLIPDGGLGLPSAGPVAAVTSVNGQTGAVTVSTATADGAPDAAVAALVTDSASATRTALAATYTPLATLAEANPAPFFKLSRNTPGGPAPIIIGQDATHLFFGGAQSGGIGQSNTGDASSPATFGFNWSGSKGTPTNVSWGDCVQIVTFKGNHYLLARDGTTNRWCIYRTAPAINDDPWSWTKVHTLTAGSTGDPGTLLGTDGTTLLVGEYGDPTGGPHIWRTTDGTTWASVWTAADCRHVHAIEPDPYNAGHFWATTGDGIPYTVLRSTDGGASWAVNQPSPNFQAVQISFDPNYVYLASDNANAPAFLVYERATGKWRGGAPNSHREFGPRETSELGDGAVATAANYYSPAAYFGAVDPTTGFYYAVANQAGTNIWNGLFYSPGVGQALHLLSRGGPQGQSLNGRVRIYGGRVWSGLFNAPLLAR